MKTFLFVPLVATLLTATSAFAAPLPAGPGYSPFDHDRGRDGYNGYNQAYRPDYREHDHWGEGRREAPRYDRDQAYGYGRSQHYDYDQNQGYGYSQNQGYGYAGNQQYGYNQGQSYGYGYDRDQRVIVQPQPQYRRPVAVSLHVGVY